MARTIETPIMPIEPATETIVVRLRLDKRFFIDSDIAISGVILVFLRLPFFFFNCFFSALVSSLFITSSLPS